MTRENTPHYKSLELVISLGIWLFVLLVTLHLWENTYPGADYRLVFSKKNLALIVAVFLINITAKSMSLYFLNSHTILIMIEALSLLLLLFLFPNGIIILIGIMLVAQLNNHIHIFFCFISASLLPTFYFFQLPAEHAWFNVALFCLLNYFAYIYTAA